MENKNLKPLLIATIELIAKGYAANYASVKNEVQKVIDLYGKMNLPPLTSGDLHGLFSDTETLLYDKMTGGEQAHLVMGKADNSQRLAIDKKKAMEMITKPSGYSALLAGVDNCIKICTNGFGVNTTSHIRIPATNLIEYFVIDEKGKLQFSDKAKDEIDRAGKVFITTEKGQAIYGFLGKVAAAFNEFGIAKLMYNPDAITISGENVAKIIAEGIRIVDTVNGGYTPITTASQSAFPRVPFDRE